jgi:hypothetical protein
MAFDEALAERIRLLLVARNDVREQRMFGGLTFLVGGNMCCGVHGDELIVRVAPEHQQDLLARPHTRPMDFTRRPMRGFVTVAATGLEDGALRGFVADAVRYASSLPGEVVLRPIRVRRAPTGDERRKRRHSRRDSQQRTSQQPREH